MKHKRGTLAVKTMAGKILVTLAVKMKVESEAVARPPPYAEVAEEFSTLEAKARSSGMEDGSFHLGKARTAWIRAHASSKKGQQQDIRSFFDT